MINWERYNNFERWEFDSPDLEGSGDMMQDSFIDRLQKARSLSKVSFTINSGYRTSAHNASDEVKGSKTSSHLGGWAADIKCKNSGVRYNILAALIMAGFTRIGIGETFIHVDNDPTKGPAIWTYY